MPVLLLAPLAPLDPLAPQSLLQMELPHRSHQHLGPPLLLLLPRFLPDVCLLILVPAEFLEHLHCHADPRLPLLLPPPPADCGAGAAFDTLPPCFSNAACIWLAPTRRALSTASFLRFSLAALSAALSPLLFLCVASILPAGLLILMQAESGEQFLHVAGLRTERFGGRRHGFCASTKILHLTHLTG